jgi:hypothetical protein
MVLGACVYENSRHVIEIKTSDAVRMAYARTCHAIEGVKPASIWDCKFPIIINDGTATNKPILIFFIAVSSNNEFNFG